MKQVADFFAAIVGFVGFTISLGYLYGTPFLYGGNIIPVALPTAITFILVGVGLLTASEPDASAVGVFMGPTVHSRLLRSFLPTIIALVLIDDIFLKMTMFSSSNPALISALTSLLSIIVFGVIVSKIASSIGGEIDQVHKERDRAEAELRISEKKYRNIFSNVQDVFYLTDLQGNILDISPSVFKYSGYTRKELLGKSTGNFYHNPQDRAVMLDTLQKTGEIVDFEVRMKSKDDRLVVVSVNSHLLYDESGKPTGIEGSLRDITRRKTIERKIQKYSDDLEQLLSISREMTSTINLKKLKRFAILASKELLRLDFSTMMLLSEDTTRMTFEDCIGFPESMIGQFSRVEGQGLSTYVIKSKKYDVMTDPNEEKRFEVPELVNKYNIHSAICVPMMIEDNVFGVLIGHTTAKREFSQEEVMLYQSIGNQSAIAIKNAMNLEALRISEKKLHDITSHIAEGLYVMDLSRQITYINNEALRLLGWTLSELNEKGIHELVHSRKADGTPYPAEECGLLSVIKTGKRYVSSDEVFLRKDAVAFPALVVSSPILENGRVVSAIVAFRDITEQKKSEDALRESEKRFRALFETMTEGVALHEMIYSKSGVATDYRIVAVNPAFEIHTGLSAGQAIGSLASTLYGNTPTYLAEYAAVASTEKPHRFETFNESLGKHFRIEAFSLSKDKFVTIFEDITERKKTNDELKRLNEVLARQATTDPLTGISNRAKFREIMEIEITRCRRFSLPLSLIMFDIDHFKKVNDTYGHNTGDDVLRELTSLVSKPIRQHDLFARWGGEEFLIMVTNTTKSGAAIFAEKLRHSIETYNFPAVSRVTCSFGVGEFERVDTIDSFVQKVDAALYRAKSAGRNRVESG